MRYEFVLSSTCFLLICIAEVAASVCPRPTVKKRTIIQSNDSIQNGAQLIAKDVVSSARECYDLCCSDAACNTAVMHYKQKVNVLGDEITEKYCFLFDCGYPSVCSFQYHYRYAIIDLGAKNDVKSVIKNADAESGSGHEDDTTQTIAMTAATTALKSVMPKSTTQKTVKTEIQTTFPPKSTIGVISSSEIHHETPDDITEEEKCPPGTPVAMCSDDPCKINSCPSDSDAVCKRNYCGGCNAVFYKNGDKANCSLSDVATSESHNEQSITISESDYGETPEETLMAPKSSNTKGAEEDTYYNSDKRKWLDDNDAKAAKGMTTQNPSSPRVILVEKPVGNSLMSLPLLIALIICIILLIGLIYRVKCARRGKAKKLPVDDGDYLINGMYL